MADARPALSAQTALLLTAAPLLWAGNAVVGRLVHELVAPAALNFLRWLIAFALLAPLAWRVLAPASPMWPHWRRYCLLGLLGVGSYNTLQYLALQTSSPLNVTLVAAGTPIWMLLLGALFFGTPVSRRQLAGALASVSGVLLVLAQGSWQTLAALRLVPGDVYMVLATLAWALYSWLLARTEPPAALRGDWAALLLAQLFFGLLWSGAFAGAEWALGASHLRWSWTLAAALLFIAVGPALAAYRCWGLGVQRAGPVVSGFFSNLTPLFAALLSAAFLGEMPRLHHAVAFALIVGGIVVSARRG